MKIALTGAGGFIGSTLASTLVKQGFEVYPILYPTQLIPEKLQTLELPIQRCDLATGAPDLSGMAAIVHAAGRTLKGGSTNAYYCDNIVATYHICQAAKKAGVARMVNFSTLSIYGTITTAEVDENTPSVNPGCYGISKLMAEEFVHNLPPDMHIISLRIPGVVGKNAHTHLLARLLEKAKRNEPIEIFNPHNLFNNLIHAQNISDFIVHLFKEQFTGRTKLTLSSSNPLCFEDIIKIIFRKTHSSSPVTISRNQQLSFLVSHHKAKQEFGFRPYTTQAALEQYLEDEMQ